MAFVFKALGPLEKIMVIVVLAGATLKYLHLTGADEILMLSMSTLAAVFYLRGFNAGRSGDTQQQQTGFADLFAGAIVPKVSWIACSVVVIGALFAMLNLRGAGEMLAVGVSALSMSCIFAGYFLVTGSVFTPALINVLYRAAPLCAFGWYMFMNLPPAHR